MRRRVSAARAVATISRTAPCARAARAMDEPISPTPIRARRLNIGATLRVFSVATVLRRPSKKLTERFDEEPIGVFGADAHAQRIRQLVGADLTQDEAARGKESVGLLRRPPFGRRKVDQQKIGDAWRDFKAEFSI